eukprot:TRINITY_DN8065_c0_g1_i1.p1 TRINITY_DN8065_c0_g1~~TRINITY_DN8065_c0_g1_i1.p1  ORF type:complete len:461 (+),score=158.40 TRINITY_DN8065_c0_g1_i1:114-1496(+)
MCIRDSKGGVLETNPLYQNCFRLLGYPNAKDLAEIMACVGLAQNFAALRALAVEGIQKGHMSLHAKNLALSVGVPYNLAPEAAEFMKASGRITSESAKAYLEAHDLYNMLRIPANSKRIEKPLSTFLVEVKPRSLKDSVMIHVALDCGNPTTRHLAIKKVVKNLDSDQQKLQQLIFGDKGFEWLTSFLDVMDLIHFTTTDKQSQTREFAITKLKLLSILVNIVTFNLLRAEPKKTQELFQVLKNGSCVDGFMQSITDSTPEIRYGLSLLSELVRIFRFTLDSLIQTEWMKRTLIQELLHMMNAIIKSNSLWEQAMDGAFDLNQFMAARKKRLSGTMMLFCDALHLKDNELSTQYFSVLEKLGDAYELEAMVARDLQRRKKNEENIYSYWLMMLGKQISDEDMETKMKFISTMESILGPRREEIRKILTPSQLQMYKRTQKLISEYYKQNGEEVTGTRPKL